MTPFETLLKDLGNYMEIPLHPDSNQSCRLSFFSGTLFIQIDLTPSGDRILIGSELGTLTPGSYRENILQQALKRNKQVEACGILAYSEKKNELILFQFFALSEIKPEALFQFLEFFAQEAKAWSEAIQKGIMPDRFETKEPSLEAPFDIGAARS